MRTMLIAPQGVVELNTEPESAGFRWLTEDGEDTETSALTYDGAIKAGLAAWPEGIVVIVPQGIDADGLADTIYDALL